VWGVKSSGEYQRGRGLVVTGEGERDRAGIRKRKMGSQRGSRNGQVVCE
jgi:hypothetical protein